MSNNVTVKIPWEDFASEVVAVEINGVRYDRPRCWPCGTCGGKGWRATGFTESGRRTCPDCGGSGVAKDVPRDVLGRPHPPGTDTICANEGGEAHGPVRTRMADDGRQVATPLVCEMHGVRDCTDARHGAGGAQAVVGTLGEEAGLPVHVGGAAGETPAVPGQNTGAGPGAVPVASPEYEWRCGDWECGVREDLARDGAAAGMGRLQRRRVGKWEDVDDE